MTLPRGRYSRLPSSPGSSSPKRSQSTLDLSSIGNAIGIAISGRLSRASGLDKRHGDVRVLAQPRCEHAARRACADDHVVVHRASFICQGT